MFYVSCTQDDMTTVTSDPTATETPQGFINFELFEQKIGSSNAFKDNSIYFDGNKIPLTRRGGEFVEAYIDTETIHLIETETMNFYTLRIINNNPEERTNIFYNLVFEEHLETGEVSSVIIQYHPELEWLFNKSEPFKGEIIKYDNQIISIEDLWSDTYINSELRGAIIPCSISIVWECIVNNHPPGTPNCGGGG